MRIFAIAHHASGSPTRQPGSPGLLALAQRATFPTSSSQSLRPSTRHAIPHAARTPVVSKHSLGGVFGWLPAALGVMIAGTAPFALWWRRRGGVAARAVVGCWSSSHRRSDHAEKMGFLTARPSQASLVGVGWWPGAVCIYLLRDVVVGCLLGTASRGSVKSKVRVSS